MNHLRPFFFFNELKLSQGVCVCSKSGKIQLSPQLNEPVEYKEDKKAEEQHVAQQFGLTASGQLFDSADGGAQQAAR